MILIIPMHIMIHIIVGDPGSLLILALASAWAMDMEAMDMEAMVIRPMVGVTRPMAGDTLITDTDHTGQVIIVDTTMVIMAEADMDTIIPHLITPILKDVVASMVTVSPGQDIRDMAPGT